MKNYKPFANIELKRNFRDYVKIVIRHHPFWHNYIQLCNWENHTHLLLADDWRYAAFYLDIDLNELYSKWWFDLPISNAIEEMIEASI